VKLSMRNVDKAVGITTTIPIEVVFAAGYRPLDLNNAFITSPSAARMVEDAEAEGFPRNMCAWVKGIYTAVREVGVKRVVGVCQGDCSNTHALLEVLQTEGVEVMRFDYPYDRKEGMLGREMKKLAEGFGTTVEAGEEMRRRLEPLRVLAREIDELTWKENKVSGEENHLYLINCSDMKGDYETYEREMREFVETAERRERWKPQIRLGYVGIPPICGGLYSFVEKLGAGVVFNEMQRQFSMPHAANSLLEQYLCYTYPYDVFFRMEDIQREIRRRKIQGLIHYVQSFCFRQIQDRILREMVEVPVLTLECDRPAELDERSKTRLQAFVEMLNG